MSLPYLADTRSMKSVDQPGPTTNNLKSLKGSRKSCRAFLKMVDQDCSTVNQCAVDKIEKGCMITCRSTNAQRVGGRVE